MNYSMYLIKSYLVFVTNFVFILLHTNRGYNFINQPTVSTKCIVRYLDFLATSNYLYKDLPNQQNKNAFFLE